MKMINNKNNKLEHLVYFQKLLEKLSPNSMNIDNFIQHSFSEILERQYQHDKSKKEVRNRNEFREKYFQVDERTYRRWRNNEVDSIRNDSLPDFRKLSVLKEMYNENHINEFYKNIVIKILRRLYDSIYFETYITSSTVTFSNIVYSIYFNTFSTI